GLYTIGTAGGSFNSIGTDEAWFFDYMLSEADWLEIFESAGNRLPMYVDFYMRTSMTADLTPPPTYAAFPYSHDFTHVLTERLIRKTEVIETKDGGEERSGQADKTRQRYTYTIPILDAAARRKLK